VDDVATVIVLRDIGGNAGVYVTRDVLAADHEAERLARIEGHCLISFTFAMIFNILKFSAAKLQCFFYLYVIQQKAEMF